MTPEKQTEIYKKQAINRLKAFTEFSFLDLEKLSIENGKMQAQKRRTINPKL